MQSPTPQVETARCHAPDDRAHLYFPNPQDHHYAESRRLRRRHASFRLIQFTL